MPRHPGNTFPPSYLAAPGYSWLRGWQECRALRRGTTTTTPSGSSSTKDEGCPFSFLCFSLKYLMINNHLIKNYFCEVKRWQDAHGWYIGHKIKTQCFQHSLLPPHPHSIWKRTESSYWWRHIRAQNCVTMPFQRWRVIWLMCRAALNIFCLVSKVFPEEFVLRNAGLYISKNAAKQPI